MEYFCLKCNHRNELELTQNNDGIGAVCSCGNSIQFKNTTEWLKYLNTLGKCSDKIGQINTSQNKTEQVNISKTTAEIHKESTDLINNEQVPENKLKSNNFQTTPLNKPKTTDDNKRKRDVLVKMTEESQDANNTSDLQENSVLLKSNPLNLDQIARNLRKFNIEINLNDYDPKIFRYVDQRIILITLQTKVFYKPGSETFCIT